MIVVPRGQGVFFQAEHMSVNGANFEILFVLKVNQSVSLAIHSNMVTTALQVVLKQVRVP